MINMINMTLQLIVLWIRIKSLLLFVLPIAINVAVGEPRLQERVSVGSDRIVRCVSRQLPSESILSYFQSALVRCWQPFSVMPLSPEYKHSYRGTTLSGAATAPSQGAHIPYLRCSCCLIYFLITEAEDSQSAEVGSAEGDAPLLSDVIPICI